MDTKSEIHHQPLRRAIEWTLRFTVALQCLGNWRWLTQLEETPLLHWMLDPADIGGLAWSESTALTVQQFVGWAILAAGGLVLLRPYPLVLAALSLFQILMPIAMWRIADGYALQASFLTPELLLLFPFTTQLARVAAPVGLLLWVLGERQSRLTHEYIDRVMLLLRWALAVVFVAHGIEALQHNPKFLDLLIQSNQRLGINMSQEAAETCLSMIGALDMMVAVACVSVRSLAVMGWIALWGFVTAASRIVANGWEVSWHATLTRIPHFGVPLAVVLWFYLLKSKPPPLSEEVEHDITGRDTESASETY